MPNIQLSDLEDYLKGVLKECVFEVGKKVNELYQERIDKDVYQAGYETNYYIGGSSQPSFELRNSVTTSEVKTSGNETSVEIFHDVDKMESNPNLFQHGSNYWHQTDIRDILPEIVAFGLSGDFFGEDQWWQNPRPFYQNTIEELKNQGKLKLWLKEALEKHGLKVI